MVIGNVAELRDKRRWSGWSIRTGGDQNRENHAEKKNHYKPALLPGWGGQCDDESLQKSSDKGERVFASEEVVEERQQDEAVHKQTGQDRDEVHAQHLSQVGRVVHVQDFSCHKEHNAKGEVPTRGGEDRDHGCWCESSFTFLQPEKNKLHQGQSQLGPLSTK